MTNKTKREPQNSFMRFEKNFCKNFILHHHRVMGLRHKVLNHYLTERTQTVLE